jgi:cell division protein FtsB
VRRKRVAPAPMPPFRRKPIQILLVFVTAVLLIDALIGERGLIERMQAGRQYRDAQADLQRLRLENARLLEHVQRLNKDLPTIESVARKDLGLMRPGEVLFIIKDVKPVQ